jgi:hypothetical protein
VGHREEKEFEAASRHVSLGYLEMSFPRLKEKHKTIVLV